MSANGLLSLIAVLAFISGFAMQKGNVCSVLAARQIVELGRATRLYAFMFAAAWALAATVLVVWASVTGFKLAPSVPVTYVTVLAGIGYGAGCFINAACIFGICARSTSGGLHFLFALPGIALGAALISQSGVLVPVPHSALPVMAKPNFVSVTLYSIAVVLVGVSVLRITRAYGRGGLKVKKLLTAGRWRSSLAMAVIGVVGGLLNATGEPVGYPVMIRHTGAYLLGLSAVFTAPMVVGSFAVFAGAMFAALLGGRFALRWPQPLASVRCLIGGAVMGAAAALIPGGNDVMLLYAVPSLALNGIVAYVVMFATLIGLGFAAKWLADRRCQAQMKADAAS